ncbi:MAG: hypothetical protein K940chlam3_00251 [Chlamydiae bacterium]|nr:hypothetical protein [Chlamydiota bacterium]
MEVKFNHPYSYDLATTQFFTTKSALDSIHNSENIMIIDGSIEWSSNSGCKIDGQVSKEVIFIGLDDAIGQGNKILKQFGVTAFLEVSYESKVPLGSRSFVEVVITKREKSRSGAMKTFCSATMMSESKKVQASATALFIDKKSLHSSPVIKRGDMTERFEIKRLKPLDHSIVLNYHSMVSLSDHVVNWHDGQGPKECVHGGVMSIPVFHSISEKVNAIHINFRRPISLGSESEISLKRDSENSKRLNFAIMQKESSDMQFNGFAVTE